MAKNQPGIGSMPNGSGAFSLVKRRVARICITVYPATQIKLTKT